MKSAESNFIYFRDDQYEETIWVVWNDCAMADYIAKRIPKCILEYTIEINPPECVETPVKSVMYHTIPDLNITRHSPISYGRDAEDVQGSPSNANSLNIESKYKYKARFDASEIQGKEVNITVATELDGKTVTQINFTETIKVKPKQLFDNKETAQSTDLDSLVHSNIKFIDDPPVQNTNVPKSVSSNTKSIRKTSYLDYTGKNHNVFNDMKEASNRKESYAVQNRIV